MLEDIQLIVSSVLELPTLVRPHTLAISGLPLTRRVPQGTHSLSDRKLTMSPSRAISDREELLNLIPNPRIDAG